MPFFACAVSAVFIVILLLANYLAIGFVLRNTPKLRRVLISAAIVPMAFYVVCLWLLPQQSSYQGCDVYTKEMNGEVHTFQGEDYKIELCGIDGVPGIPVNGRHDEIHLKVFAMDRELLAERFFRPADDNPAPLDYQDDSLTYWSSNAHENRQEKITMPPSRWEWVRARLPRMWP